MKIINNSYNNTIFSQKVKQLTPKQTAELIEALQTSICLDEVAAKTNLKPDRIRYFCKHKLGKKYTQIKREAISEILKTNQDNKALCQKFKVSKERVKLIQYGSKQIKKEDLVVRSLNEQIKYLWEKGLSVEDIAAKTKSEYDYVFNYLATEAQNKGPWIG